MTSRAGTALAIALAGALAAPAAGARTATPGSLRSVRGLGPGEVMQLAPGTYGPILIRDCNGTPDRWITVAGPPPARPGAEPPAKLEGRRGLNTVEIENSSYVAIVNLTIDARNIRGAFGVSAKGGARNRVHHVRVENCWILNCGSSQQAVGISIKTPTWGWVIRGNRIIGAGTGMYLGNSNGREPFVAGVIENNLIKDAIGYCCQVKWQLPRPRVAGMPEGPSVTVIRNNVFIKSDRPSPDGDRPSLLVSGGPDSGPGKDDRYEIYGNLFVHNPRESLLQAAGRVSIHDNIFVDTPRAAIRLQNHQRPLKLANVYSNTIYSCGTGIAFSSKAPEGSSAVGNLIFAAIGITGRPRVSRGNVVLRPSAAAGMLRRASVKPGEMDLYPVAGCRGGRLDLSAFSKDLHFDLDFNGRRKDFTWRGAYSGGGENPGWKLAAEPKAGGPGSGAELASAKKKKEEAGKPLAAAPPRPRPAAGEPAREEPSVDPKAAKLYRSARAAERAGMKAMARTFYERLVKEHPDSPLAEKAKGKLE